MFFNFDLFLNISKTSTGICLKLKRFITYHKKNMQVKVYSSVLKNSLLTFAKVMPLCKFLNKNNPYLTICHVCLKLFIEICQSNAPL